MFYRLPLLFSITYYILLLVAQIVELLFGQTASLDSSGSDINIAYFIWLKMVYNLTAFFYMLILSCAFFYQNKLYFYTSQNKQKVIILAAILVTIYSFIKIALFKFASLIILPKLFMTIHLDYSYYNPNLFEILYQSLSIFAHIWSSIIIAIIFYLMVKLRKGYFQAPLIDGITSSYHNYFINDENQLNSNMSIKEYRKLYAIIFSATFCSITHGLIWNTYFPIFSSIAEVNFIIQNHYKSIFLIAILMIVFNYWFLFSVANKTIIKTYSWLPMSSILTATAITLLLFGVVMLLISSIVLPFVFGLKSMILFGLWFISSYLILYFLSRFALKRYFV